MYETDLFRELIAVIADHHTIPERTQRIIADHLRASIFLIADGVRPSNKEAGYILRRLLRRVMTYQTMYDVHDNLLAMAYEIMKAKFGEIYPEINNSIILVVMEEERDKYQNATAVGLDALNRIIWSTQEEFARKLFNIYQEFGLHIELALEILRKKVIISVEHRLVSWF